MRSVTAAFATAVGAILVLATATAPGSATQPAVSTVPAPWTPFLLQSTPSQYVLEIDQCGPTMFAVGTITRIGQGSQTYTRGNAFSFSATNGVVTTWEPHVNGTVRSIALSPDCATAYLGGSFTNANGVGVSNLVAVDAVTGAVRTGFLHTANSPVYTVEFTHGQVLVGGRFSTINGQHRTQLASLDPTTGQVTSYANLAISGSYPNYLTRIDNSHISHSGTKMLVEGVFTSIGGQARQQIAMLDLGAGSVTVDPWFSTEFNAVCAPSQSYYLRSAAWSPDDSKVYIATTGYKPPSGPGSDPNGPRDGLCDAAAAYPATAGLVNRLWINYTGCDSYYAVGADANEVFVGGHERWANNPLGCDRAGAGAVSRPGLGSLSPTIGQATAWNPTRSLGHGVVDILTTTAGVWFASDNFSDGAAQTCGGKWNKGGICFFPY